MRIDQGSQTFEKDFEFGVIEDVLKASRHRVLFWAFGAVEDGVEGAAGVLLDLPFRGLRRQEIILRTAWKCFSTNAKKAFRVEV